MPSKKLLAISFVTILLIATLHLLALRFSWYFTHRWIDIVIHILGGFWVALTALWVALRFKHIDTIVHYRKKVLIIMLVSVLIIGIVWELFEFLSGNTFLHTSNFWTDSFSDMINNFIGGLFAYWYFTKTKKCKNGFVC